MCGTLKNIVGLAVGILDGLDCGCNAKAVILRQGLTEMRKWVWQRGVWADGDAQVGVAKGGVGRGGAACWLPIDSQLSVSVQGDAGVGGGGVGALSSKSRWVP